MKTSKRAAGGDAHTKALASSDDEADGGWWRVLLLRGLIEGDLAVVERVLLEHIDALSAPFTNAMPPWKLQWESLHWWLLQDATPLCVASMYAHPTVVRWLLRHGADRATPCYLQQPALAYVGECCAHTAVNAATGSRATASAECMQLLRDPPALPCPPGSGSDAVALSSTFSSEVVLVRSSSAVATPVSPARGGTSGPTTIPTASSSSTAPLQQQRIFKCLVHVAWPTPLSNGALIDKYEVRYRCIGADDRDAPSGTNSNSSTSGSSESWRLERVTHNRKRCEQRIVLAGLQFDTLYEVTLRSWSAAGKGDWSRSYRLETCAAPPESPAS